MRRFPPPPNQRAAGPSTPSRRSTEAPMQYEWEQPRAFPASPFAATSSAAIGSDGEPARKRTHYDAMDVDTPPRASFPASATATSNPFHFAEPSSSSKQETTKQGHLDFDADAFDPKGALGLENEDNVSSGHAADESMTMVEESERDVKPTSGALTVLNGAETRRRKIGGVSKKGRSPERQRKARSHDSEDDEEQVEHHATIGAKGRKPPASDFSFQVHHHHAPDTIAGHGPERWLDSNTPHTLLGYLQFGSLTLLAVLVLSLASLFLYTLLADIQARLASLGSELRAEILQCAKAYVDNRCEPEMRIPAMERRCAGWEECMGREVVVVGKTRVVAETLAEVVNGFVDVISFKTMLFVLLTLGLCIYGSSMALAHLPSRSAPSQALSSPAIGPPHFQHLGGFQPYGYTLPSNAQGPGWGPPGAENSHLGVAAPAAAVQGRTKGWFR